MSTAQAGPNAEAQLCAVPSGVGQRLRISWGAGSELFCTPVGEVEADQERCSSSSTVQWDVPGPLWRQTLYDCSVAYLEFERGRTGPGEGREQVGTYCDAVVSILQSAVAAQAAGGAPSEDAWEQDSLAKSAAVCDLVATFFWRSGLGDESFVFSMEFAWWVRRHAAALLPREAWQQLRPAAVAEFARMDCPELDPGYWSTLKRMASLGWTDEALRLLGLHSDWAAWRDRGSRQDPAMAARVRCLDTVAALLRAAPVAGLGQHDALAATGADLLATHAAWRARAAALAADEGLWALEADDGTAQLRELLQLVSGGGALRELEGSVVAGRHPAGSWLEALTALLLGRHPAARRVAELREALRCAVAARPPPADEQPVLVAALVERDPQGVLQAASLVGAPWLPAHVAAALAPHPAGGDLCATTLGFYEVSQAEFYALNLAEAMLCALPTRSVAQLYMDWCPRHGQYAACRAIAKGVAVHRGSVPALQGLASPDIGAHSR